MQNLVEQYEKTQIEKVLKIRTIPNFRAGDTVAVSFGLIENEAKKMQIYEGVVIARENKGINSSFLIRKVSHGEGSEKKFMIYSPILRTISVLKRGDVRRAKLFYLRDLKGKAARIKEKKSYTKK